jgi:hypothetical protein
MDRDRRAGCGRAGCLAAATFEGGMNLQDGLLLLMTICEKLDMRIILEYDTGRFVTGDHLDLKHPEIEPDPKYIEQGPKGWTIEISNYGITDPETGKDELFTLAKAVAQGLAMVKELSKEKK